MTDRLVDESRLGQAIAAIDAANADDPHTIVVDGVERPKELAHSEMMTGWVSRLDPQAGEAQLIAARAHHLRRWSIPRTSYPRGRKGYLRWREDAKQQHAREVAELLAGLGYENALIDRVQRIIRKEGLGSDAAVQVHEDALCLVFLQTQLAAIIEDLGPSRVVNVLRKTFAKMSERGRREALALPLSEAERRLVDQALAAAGEPRAQ